jgi:hypothetical protein
MDLSSGEFLLRQPFVALFGDRQFDALRESGQTDERLRAFADDEDVAETEKWHDAYLNRLFMHTTPRFSIVGSTNRVANVCPAASFM